MSKKQLLDLPAELLEHVAEQSNNKQDLKSLRLACRDLHAAADRAFIDAFFTHRTHLVTKYSLDTLVSITSIPRLRSQLKSLKFATNIILSLVDQSLHEPPASIEELLSSLEELKSAEYQEKSTGLEAGLFGEDHVALASVVTIFSNLRAAGVVLTLGINPDLDGEAFGRHQLAEMIGLDPLLPQNGSQFIWYGNKMRTTEMLLRAVVDTRLQIDGLEFLGAYEGAGFGVVAVADDMSRLPGLRQSFRFLVSVDLDCGDVFDFERSMYDSFMTVFESPVALQHLSLSQLRRSETEKDLFRKIITTCARFDLKSIKLQEFSTTPREMLSLLTPHRTTLESLELIDVCTEGADSYTLQSLFSTLAADYSLRNLDLWYLWEDDKGMKSYTFDQGADQVRKGLEELAKKEDLFVPVDQVPGIEILQ
ncbi:hypothetical protein PRZ48_004896 [Zasmidium cellare]|uniref:F-box domain-containing protein n=1 Tax=Zasmidium cellare TaxID=395010 RepID=A0ABR0ERW2_ZASCE|nr:hypothetical protein PRZ48_004896 [Zasmidium cellare]